MRGGMRRGGAARRTTRRRTRRRVQRRHRRRRRRRILLVGGLVAVGVHHHRKISQQDAQRIEQSTGLSPEEMTDEELDQAMNDLNIQGEELSDEDQAYMDQTGYEYEEEDQSSYLDELEKLAQLKDQGIITEEEFQAKKAQLLGL